MSFMLTSHGLYIVGILRIVFPEECKKVRIANFPGGITIYNRSCAFVSAWQHGVQKIDLGKLTAGSVIKFHGDRSPLKPMQIYFLFEDVRFY
jgi:hypothetical protein